MPPFLNYDSVGFILQKERLRQQTVLMLYAQFLRSAVLRDGCMV